MNFGESPFVRTSNRVIQTLTTDHPETVLTPWSGIVRFFSEWQSWTTLDIVILLFILFLDIYVFAMVAFYGLRPALQKVRPLYKVGIVSFFFLCWITFTFLGLVGQVMVPLMLRNHHGV